jgi:hypothetical protein
LPSPAGSKTQVVAFDVDSKGRVIGVTKIASSTSINWSSPVTYPLPLSESVVVTPLVLIIPELINPFLFRARFEVLTVLSAQNTSQFMGVDYLLQYHIVGVHPEGFFITAGRIAGANLDAGVLSRVYSYGETTVPYDGHATQLRVVAYYGVTSADLPTSFTVVEGKFSYGSEF